MLEKLIAFDQNLFELLNSSGVGLLDPVMIQLSSFWIWMPVIATIILLALRKDIRKGTLLLLLIILTITLTDLISAQVFKDSFQRLRPCHEPDMVNRVRLVAKSCGGQFGFVSSHTSNAFGLAMLSSFALKIRWFSISVLIWAVLVSLSRIYLGVHYPGDVLGGFLLGSLIGYLNYKLFNILLNTKYFYEPKS